MILLKAEHLSNFKGDEENTTSFLKTLCTKQARLDNKHSMISHLNQPNIISGVCAGGNKFYLKFLISFIIIKKKLLFVFLVLSYADFHDLHCIMYILYTDTFTLDSENFKPLTKLFSNDLKEFLPLISTKDGGNFNKGNLYM